MLFQLKTIKLTKEQNTTRNLEEIRKIDLFADSIVEMSSHVSLFDFNKDKSAWEPTGWCC